MTTVVCPQCDRETSANAYVCAACGYSFVRERSKPYATRLHRTLAVASALQGILSLGALIYFGSFAHWSLLLYYGLVNGVPLNYYHDRTKLRTARVLYFAQTEAGTEGWVANDALPLVLLAFSMTATIAILVRGSSTY